VDPTTETAPHGFITLVSRGEDRESITTRQSEKTLASTRLAAGRRPPPAAEGSGAKMFFHIVLERNMQLHPRHFGPHLRDKLVSKLIKDVEGTCR